MKVLILSVVVALVLGLAAAFVLRGEQMLAYEAYSSPASVRIGDPGRNLVGERWNGLNERHDG